MELICPAGTPAAFRDAIEVGADAVYCGFRDETNARNFPGLNFSRAELETSIAFARQRKVKTLVAINTFMRAGDEALWESAVDDAAALGADAVILADLGLIAYAAEKHPGLRLHLSVQAGAANADHVNFLVDAFGIKRAVLPRVLTIAEVAALTRQARCETEVFVFGGLCVMEEGRCSLSSYATGKSPNMHGVCSPASHVRYRKDGPEMVSELGEFTINRFPETEAAGYPTICKGRFVAEGEDGYIFEDPVSLDAMAHLDALQEAGVAALKIEGRQRGRSYVAKVVSEIRRQLDAAGPVVAGDALRRMSEGQRTTQGSYDKRWR
ncbi:ubiquinone anaerobic biosynthesis protein UbiU [Devosia sp.]|uniref:ubiquinone anaerobic biosynthesis protein UbiU n=1 Tax=Devosia sp. TaxID=1871048 RepID=UPI002F09C5DC